MDMNDIIHIHDRDSKLMGLILFGDHYKFFGIYSCCFAGIFWNLRKTMHATCFSRETHCYKMRGNDQESLRIDGKPYITMKSFIFVFLLALIVCIEWMSVPGQALDCIHGTWLPSSSSPNSGFCSCQPGWSGPQEASGFCANGQQNLVALYSWNRTCDRSCSWSFTSPNSECGDDAQVAFKCP